MLTALISSSFWLRDSSSCPHVASHSLSTVSHLYGLRSLLFTRILLRQWQRNWDTMGTWCGCGHERRSGDASGKDPGGRFLFAIKVAVFIDVHPHRRTASARLGCVTYAVLSWSRSPQWILLIFLFRDLMRSGPKSSSRETTVDVEEDAANKRTSLDSREELHFWSQTTRTPYRAVMAKVRRRARMVTKPQALLPMRTITHSPHRGFIRFIITAMLARLEVSVRTEPHERKVRSVSWCRRCAGPSASSQDPADCVPRVGEHSAGSGGGGSCWHSRRIACQAPGVVRVW